ncbi:hypothetical protein ACF08B_38845 [Streptomyces sp. NPDC015139]|uniref:hypothetical protein n=1 Tax=Streptomyces sp. NPDC015139 TaxID=3364942 RepID=UPI0037010D1B
MEPVNEAFWRVRDLRDLIAKGTVRGNQEFGRHLRAYLAATETAQVAMRRDLGTSWPERPDGSVAPPVGG